MAKSSRDTLLAALALCCASGVFSSALARSASPPPYRDRPIVEVLRELEDPGLRFIYSSGLVPDSLRVTREPRARGGRLGFAREVLEPHGLTIRAVLPDLYAIVRSDSPARSAALFGQVIDAESGDALTGVRIELLPLGAVRWSDRKGQFRFAGVPIGSYQVRAVATDRAPLEMRNVNVEALPARGLEVRLAAAASDIEEVVVVASRYALGRESALSPYLLSGATLAQQPSVGDDALRGLSRLPGFANGGVSARSSIRGGEVGEVLVLLDGFPLRQPFHHVSYQSPFSVIDEHLLREVGVYTGGFPVRYGNRMAGVIDLNSVAAHDEPQHALGLSFFNASGLFSGSLNEGREDWLLSARVGTLKPLLRNVAPDEGRPRNSDFFGRVTVNVSPALNVSAQALLADDTLELGRVTDDEHVQVDGHTASAWMQAFYQPQPSWSARFWLGQTAVRTGRAGAIDKPGLLRGGVDDQRRSRFTDWRGIISWNATPRQWFEFGFERARERTEYSYHSNLVLAPAIAAAFARPASNSRGAEFDSARDRTALFASHRWRLAEAWTTELGLRAQHVSVRQHGGSWSLDPRINLRRALGPNTNLKLHFGRFHQADESNELRPEDGLLDFPEVQRSDQLILGLEHRFTSGAALRVEAYRKLQADPRARVENLLNSLAFLPELAPDRIVVAPDSSQIRGVEASLSWGNEPWKSSASLAVSEAFDESGGVRTPRSWDQRYALSLGTQWVRGPWRFGAAIAARDGWPTTTVTQNAARVIDVGPRNAVRLPMFFTLDLRGAYRRPVRRGSLEIALEITNATRRRNTCCTDVDGELDANGELALLIEPKHSLPLIPSLSLRWEY